MAANEVSTGVQEPPMFLQRPSSAKSQDVQHVLAKTFRKHFARDVVAPDTVSNLTISKGGDDSYHEKYVEALQQIKEERERRMAEAAMLERHIMQAQARAMSADERNISRLTSHAQGFPDIGLPPPRPHFMSCIDNSLLKDHNLITPDDYQLKEPPAVPPPSAPKVPHYAEVTEKVVSGVKPAWKTPEPVYKHPSSVQSASICDTESINSLPRIIDSRELPPLEAEKTTLWKSQLDTETREINRKDLASLEGRVDFLKNPRHQPPSAAPGARTLIKPQQKAAKQINIKPPPLDNSKSTEKEPSTIFIATPEVVTFSHYSVGQVYELTLELKNVTTVLRPVRVLPPKTQFFSVGLGQFPGEHGLVAPGMSCHYTIRFAPDSLGDYDDELVVQTQSKTPLVVEIQGRRPPPVITLPEVLDCGQCLVGGVKISQFEVKNHGGPGRFAMIKQCVWPAANFKSVTSIGAVVVPPFEIRPCVFELNRNETMTLECLFVPNEVEEYSHEVAIVCDNCHVKQLSVKGAGQIASVELTSVEDGLSEPLPDELCDITAQHLVKFSNLNPFTYVQKNITVQNNTNVDLQYNWIVVKPYIRARDPEGIEEVPIPSERIQDVDSAFSVEPDQGVLEGTKTMDFTMTFAPPVVQKFHNVLHMVLRGIPKPRSESADADVEEDPQKILKTAMSQDKQQEDVTALEVEVKGVCEPLSVVIQPYAIHIPGQIMMQTAIKRQFRMINNSLTAILFQWENVGSESLILEVEPPIGEIMPQSDLDLDLTICGSQPGKVDHTLQCFVQHIHEPLTLHIDVEIKGPEIVIEQSNINFGLVRLGEKVETKLTLRNDSRAVAKWCIKESPMHRSSEYADESEFTFKPQGGDLKPLEFKDIKVVFRPDKCQSVRSIFEVRVDYGTDSAVTVLAEVQSPTACLLTSKLKMDNVYLDTPVCNQVELLNQTMLPTTFRWGEAEGKQADVCSVSVEPQQGRLGPREKLPINVHLTAHAPGKICDVTIPCQIEGMSKPLFLMLRTDVKGLSVSYKIMDQNKQEIDDDEVRIQFGKLQLGDVSTRYILIKNESAVPAPINICVEHFYMKPPTPPEARVNVKMPTKTQRRAMLAKTPNLADPLSKTDKMRHAEINKMMLKEDNGLAITALPGNGHLQPFGSELIEVTCYSDMWGVYTDKVICKVGHLDLVKIPLSITVVGNPLHFQMVTAMPEQQPRLRFGSQVSGIKPLTRQMRINNSSPFDIRLDWQVFKGDNDPKKLLDFIVSYGRLFPEKDANGDEIVPPLPEPHKVSRYPTEYIPNSPDTSKTITEAGLSKCNTETGVLETSAESTQVFDEEPKKQERPKVITVTLRNHIGIETYQPYSVTPDQVVIPARGNGCINVVFKPFPNDQVTEDIECLGFSLGYATVKDNVAHIEGKVKRFHGYDIDPLRLEMTGEVKPALLNLESIEDEGMRYCCAASDLMPHGKLQSEFHKLCSATISNTTLTPIHFRLVTSDPFHIIELDPVTRKPRRQLLQTSMTSLQHRQNMMVQVGFRLSIELLEQVDALTDSSAPKPEGVELEENGPERKLHFTQDLVVEFNNKTKQKLAMYATVVIPNLMLSRDCLDFGTCLVGQQREMEMAITNPTASASYWVTSTGSKSSTCADDTVSVQPSSGMLEAQVSFVSRSKSLVKIFFLAKHAEEYEAEIVFHGFLGENPQRLLVKGTGSYDGKHEAILNI